MTGLGEITLKSVTIETAAMGITLVCLLFLSGFVSGSEVAYFSLKPTELESVKKGENSRDRLITKLLSDPQRLLATILIANNLVNITIVMLSAYLSTALVDFGSSSIIRFITETIIITALILLFGEIVPKIFASQHRLSFARFAVGTLNIFQKVLKPFARVLMMSTNVVKNKLSKHKNVVSQDDLSQALELTSASMSDEKDMLEGIVKFMDLEVCDIMTPRVDVICTQYSHTFKELLHIIVESGFSRLPVIGDKPDDIKGIIYVKDVLRDLNNDENHDWHPLIRKSIFVPKTKKVNDMLTEFQSTKTHMAIIVDEYGGMQGVITLEDIIEEIVGEISDGDDEDDKEWEKLPDGSYIFEAKISLNDFFKVIGIDPETFDDVRGEAETLAGLLLEKNGIIPKKNDKIEIHHYKFVVLSADIRKIDRVKLIF